MKKTIFGFIAGAALGAGGLFGLKKVLSTLEKGEAPATAGGPTPPAVKPSPVKVETVAAPSIKKEEPTLEATKATDDVSMVGEPEGRHIEPGAATETDSDATSPRSETAEPAVPDEPEVKEAAGTTPINTTSDNGSTGNGARKSSRTSRTNPDDFTVIIDIGPVFNQKLHDAGINSFKALAKLTPAEISEKTGIPAERIEYNRWLEQVQELLDAGEQK